MPNIKQKKIALPSVVEKDEVVATLTVLPDTLARH